MKFKDNKLLRTIAIIAAVITGIAAVVTPAVLLIRRLREKAAAVADQVQPSVSDEAPDAADAAEAPDAAAEAGTSEAGSADNA